MPQFLVTIVEIVKAAGLFEEFTRRGHHFHVTIENGPYQPLVIEAWDSPIVGDAWRPTSARWAEGMGGRRISVAHYFELNGDLVPDPEVEIRDDGWPIELSQVLGYTQVTVYREDGTMLFAPQSRQDVLHFLDDTWAPNLRAQRFIEAAQKLAQPAEAAA